MAIRNWKEEYSWNKALPQLASYRAVWARRDFVPGRTLEVERALIRVLLGVHARAHAHKAPHQPAQPFKFTISESCDRIKEEFQFLQAQYHSLKLECEKLASEKTEMQRHYVMVSKQHNEFKMSILFVGSRNGDKCSDCWSITVYSPFVPRISRPQMAIRNWKEEYSWNKALPQLASYRAVWARRDFVPGRTLEVERALIRVLLGVHARAHAHKAPHQPAQPFKFTISESCDRIKEEFQFLQAQYHSLKLECEKLASEKTEMQRHYVMYYEMSYGLNIEMPKQPD
nr:uncharacterized protein LOC110075993 [Pogona vitticeps]